MLINRSASDEMAGREAPTNLAYALVSTGAHPKFP